jgi:hypothetical protein
MAIKGLEIESGYFVIEEEMGRKVKIPATDLLRAVDIPDLNIDSLTLLTNLAQVVTEIVKALMQLEILEDEVGDVDLGYVLDTLQDDLGAET